MIDSNVASSFLRSNTQLLESFVQRKTEGKKEKKAHLYKFTKVILASLIQDEGPHSSRGYCNNIMRISKKERERGTTTSDNITSSVFYFYYYTHTHMTLLLIYIFTLSFIVSFLSLLLHNLQFVARG